MKNNLKLNWLVFVVLSILVLGPALVSWNYYEDRDANRERIEFELHVISNEVITDLLERFCADGDIYGSCEFYAQNARCFSEVGRRSCPANPIYDSETGELRARSLDGPYLVMQYTLQRELMAAVIFEEWKNDPLMKEAVSRVRQRQIEAGWLEYRYLMNWIKDELDINLRIDDQLRSEYPLWWEKIEESRKYSRVFIFFDFSFWGAFILALTLSVLLSRTILESFDLWLVNKGYYGLAHAILIPVFVMIQLLVYRF